MSERDSTNVGAVILAAGSSSRMGRPKQTLQFQGTSLLKRATSAALDAACRPVVVVTGAHAELSRSELDQLDVYEAFNADWQTGMGSSVRTGIERLLTIDSGVTAAVLLLCDQPHVNAEVVASLLAAYHTTGRPLIASSYGASFGAPALFSRALFTELTELRGSSGAKEIIKRHASAAHFIPFPEGAVDVDTPDDFYKISATLVGEPKSTD